MPDRLVLRGRSGRKLGRSVSAHRAELIPLSPALDTGCSLGAVTQRPRITNATAPSNAARTASPAASSGRSSPVKFTMEWNRIAAKRLPRVFREPGVDDAVEQGRRDERHWRRRAGTLLWHAEALRNLRTAVAEAICDWWGSWLAGRERDGRGAPRRQAAPDVARPLRFRYT